MSQPAPTSRATSDASGAAPAWRRVVAQAALELRLLARNGENLLVTVAIPAGALVFFALVPVLPLAGPPAEALAPRVLTIAAMGSALVALGISTAFEREHGVLARLGTTPLRRVELLTAKAGATLAVQGGQVVLLAATAVALGWRPTPSVAGVGVGVGGWLLATAAFAGIGLLLAGRLPALRALALINAVFLLLLLAGGVLVPAEALPGPAATLARLLPPHATVELLAVAARGGVPLAAAAQLGAWAAAAVFAASRLFRWDETR